MAVAAGAVHVCRLQPEGVQRETVFVHDLWLPADFTPRCHDGEAVEHKRVDLITAARLIARPDGADAVTADASLVVLDWLMRQGAISRTSPDFDALDALRHPDSARWD